jgi:hypothetical protein
LQAGDRTGWLCPAGTPAVESPLIEDGEGRKAVRWARKLPRPDTELRGQVARFVGLLAARSRETRAVEARGGLFHDAPRFGTASARATDTTFAVLQGR